MAKKNKKIEEVVEPQAEEIPVEETPEVPAEEVKAEEIVGIPPTDPEHPVLNAEGISADEAPKVACPDCTVLIADGGKSEFSGKGGPKAGLINPNTQCPACEGHGVVEAKEE